VFDCQLVLTQLSECVAGARSGVNVDQYVIEEDEDEVTDEILEHVIHQCLERGGALVNPKGMTKNSKCLWCFLKAVLSTSASFIRTWW
jgi:hypothetical protein